MESCFFLERFTEFNDDVAIIWHEKSYSYTEIVEKIYFWKNILSSNHVLTGESVSIVGDYSPNLCALLFALALNKNVVVPLTSAVFQKKMHLIEMAHVENLFQFEDDVSWNFRKIETSDNHPLLKDIRDRGNAGLVLFTSGSTGVSKATLLNLDKILSKFTCPRTKMKTLVFLLLDHIGGINTLLSILCSGGTIVTIAERNPKSVCEIIERHHIELLPTTPTFLNMLLISGEYKNYNLSSLELITYGTETMPESTLNHLNRVLPNVRLKQTYGLTELGILQSKSRDSSSLWMKVGGEGFETKVIDGTLWIRSQTAMLGYLNAPSPFDLDGWFNTGDVVEVTGDYLRILGRKSEIINVGGEKVFPSEVESVILQMDNIQDVTVNGVKNPVTGEIVVASINVCEPEDVQSLEFRLREYCVDRLEAYKIPAFIILTNDKQYSDRFKKMRLKN